MWQINRINGLWMSCLIVLVCFLISRERKKSAPPSYFLLKPFGFDGFANDSTEKKKKKKKKIQFTVQRLRSSGTENEYGIEHTHTHPKSLRIPKSFAFFCANCMFHNLNFEYPYFFFHQIQIHSMPTLTNSEDDNKKY